MKLAYEKRLHKALKNACPEGYWVSVSREGRKLFIILGCEDHDYFAPWYISEILQDFGY